MYDGPVRAGNRGGAGDFRWSDVVNDKQKDNYLGSTVNAPQGRWQKNKDIHWYARDKVEEDPEIAAKKKREEIRKLREAEEDALSVALGFAPAIRDEDGGTGTGANGIKVERTKEIDEAEREERRADKELRKEKRALKRAERELRREEKEKARGEKRGSSSRHDDRDRDRDRDRHGSRRRRDDSDDESDEERYRNRRHDDERDRGRDRDHGGRRYYNRHDRRGHYDDRDRDRTRERERDMPARSRDRSESRTRTRSPKRERRRQDSKTPEYVKRERTASPPSRRP